MRRLSLFEIDTEEFSSGSAVCGDPESLKRIAIHEEKLLDHIQPMQSGEFLAREQGIDRGAQRFPVGSLFPGVDPPKKPAFMVEFLKAQLLRDIFHFFHTAYFAPIRLSEASLNSGNEIDPPTPLAKGPKRISRIGTIPFKNYASTPYHITG